MAKAQPKGILRKTSPTWLLCSASLTAIAMLTAPGVANAQERHWDGGIVNGGNPASGANGGAGTWNNTLTNWDTAATNGDPVAWTPGADAVFGGASGGVVTIDPAGVTVSRLSFSRSGYTLNGGPITLTGTSPTIATSFQDSATINAVLAGTNGLVTGANGVLLLNGTNTLTGGITVADGTLRLGGVDSANGANNVVRVNNGAALQVATTTAFGGDTDASRLVLAGGASLGLLSNFTHDITLEGLARIAGGGHTWNGVVRLNGTDRVRFQGTLTATGDLFDNGGVLTVDTVTYGGAITFTGNLQHTGGLLVGNATVLSGLKSYSGDTVVAGWSGGVSRLTYMDAAAISLNSNVVLGDAASVGLIQFGYAAPDITLGAGGGEFQFATDGGFVSRASGVDVALTLNGGADLTWGAGSFVGAGETLYLGAETNTSTARELVLLNDIDLGAQQRTVFAQLGSNLDHGVMGGVLSGAGGLQIVGDGILELRGVNTYTGATEVQSVLMLGNPGGITGGIGATGGQSNLQINGIRGNYQNDGILVLTAGSGDFLRGVGAGGDEVRWLSDGGFTAYGAARTVNLGGGDALTWGQNGFVGDGLRLVFGGSYGNAAIDFENDFDLGALDRTIEINSINGDGIGLRLNGVISGGGALIFDGSGDVALTGLNTFTGDAVLGNGLTVSDGLEVTVSVIGAANVAGNLGAGDTIELRTHTGNLTYTGSGETTNRNWIVGARDGARIDLYSSGSGALVLTGDITKDASGASNTLALGGSFVSNDGNGDGVQDAPNIISGVISDDTGELTVQVHAFGIWRLTGDNSYEGPTRVNSGVLEVVDLADGGEVSSIGLSGSDAENLVIANGTLRYIGAGDATDRLVQLGTGARIESSGTGTLQFTNSGLLTRSGGGGNYSLTLAGTNTGDNLFAPTLTNLAPGADYNTIRLNIGKDGAGLWALTTDNNAQAHAYSGNTTITAGALRLDHAGAITGGLGTLSNHALGGDGTERSSLIVFNSTTTGGVLGLTAASGPFTRGLTTEADAFLTDGGTVGDESDDTHVQGVRWTGSGGFAAWDGTQVVDLFGDARTVTWATGGFVLNGRSLVFGYETADGTVDFRNGVNLNLAARTIHVNDGVADVEAVMSGAITGTGASALVKSGAGTLALSGTNTYAGVTTINAGTLKIGDGGGTGTLGVGNVTVATNAFIAFDRNNTYTVGHLISGGGALIQQGSGTTVLTAANTYQGGTFVNGGVLSVAADTALGDAAGGVTFDGGTLLATSSFTSSRTATMAGAGAFSADPGVTLTWAGPISGAGSMTKAGAGTMVLTGDATHLGGTTISAGTLQIGAGGTSGSLSGDIVDNGLLVFNRSDDIVYAGSITGTGGLNVIGGGQVSLTGVSAFGGDLNVTGSDLRIENGGKVTTASAGSLYDASTLVVNGPGSVLTTNELWIARGAGSSAAVRVENGGVLHVDSTSTNHLGDGAGSEGSLVVTGAGSRLDIDGSLSVGFRTPTTRGLLTIADGAAAAMDNLLIGSLSQPSSAPSTVLVTGAGSTLDLNTRLDLFKGDMNVLDGAAVTAPRLRLGSVGTANMLISGANSQVTTTDAVIIGFGNNGLGFMTLADGGALNAGGLVTLGAGVGRTGVLNIGGAEGQAAAAAGSLNAASLTFGTGGTGRLNFNHTDIGYEFAADISSAGAINHLAGDTSLTGDSSTFTGTTTVSGGTLRVNGILGDATSTVSVLGGGALGGGGTIGGDVTITDGVLRPGNSPDTLTIMGDLTLGAASLLEFEFGQANTPGGPLNDLVDVGGNLVLDGTIDVTVPATGSFGPGVYRIFNYGGLLTDNGLTVGNLPSGTGFVQTAVGGQVNLVNTAGLTLNFWDGGAGPKNDSLIQGGDGVWRLDGGQNNWTELTGTVNADYAPGGFAVFQGAGGTVTVDNSGGAVSAAGLQFTVDGYRVVGDVLTLTGAEAFVRVGDGGAGDAALTTTIEAVLDGSAQLIKDMGGTLVLSGVNTYTGGTFINGGTLSVASDGNLGDAAGGVTFDGGTLLATNSFTSSRTATMAGAGAFSADPGVTLTWAGPISGAGSMTKAGAGTMVLTGDATHLGGTTISAGTLQIGVGGTSGSLSGDIVDNGLLVFNRSDDIVYAGSITGTGAVEKRGGGTLTLTGDSSFGILSVLDEELRIDGGATVASTATNVRGPAAELTISGAGSELNTGLVQMPTGAGESGVINIENGGVMTASSMIMIGTGASNGTAVINVTGTDSLLDFSGSMQLSRRNDATTALNITDGGVVRAASAAYSSAPGVLTPTGAIDVTVSGQDSSWIITNALTFNKGTLTVLDGGSVSAGSASMGVLSTTPAVALISGANSSFVVTNDFNVAAASGTGVITVNDGALLDVGGVLRVGNGGVGVLNIGGAEGDPAQAAGVVQAGALALSALSRLNFNHTDTGYGFAASISGVGDINHLAGDTSLTGDSSAFGGTTTVSGGVLRVNGILGDATSTVSVLGGGVLGGVGVIGGDVTITDGVLAPGGASSAPGTLTIGGSLTLSGASELNFDFGQANVVGGPLNDLITIGGDLTLDGVINVADSGGGIEAGVYRVMDYSGALNASGGLDIGVTPGGTTFLVQTAVDKQVNLVNTAGLSLNFWDGGGALNNARVEGGTGIWRMDGGANSWTEVNGSANADYTADAFAIFSGEFGTVTVDDVGGPVGALGMQFATSGYIIQGDAITLSGPTATIRVGDGTADGATYLATISAQLTGATQLVKSDLGTLVLSGANTYTGGTVINQGVLRISSDANLGDIAGGLSLDGGALEVAADMTSARDVVLAGDGAIKTSVGVMLGLSGVFAGAGDLTKTGAGTLAVSNGSAFLGDVTVAQGALQVTGTFGSASTLVDVMSGATLSGAGTVGGDVAVADGGVLEAGVGGAGTLMIAGDLALSGTSVLNFELGQAGTAGGPFNDLVEVGDDLTLDGVLNVDLSAGGVFGVGVYRLFNYGGDLTDNGLALGAIPGGSEVFVQTSILGQVNLVNTAGLTLNFWDGGAGPKNDSLIQGGDGVWRLGGGATNWTDASGALNADYTQNGFVIFAGTGGTVTIDDVGGAVGASGLQFTVDGYSLTGDVLTLTEAQSVVRVGAGALDDAAKTATISATLAGSSQLAKSGAGALVLSGTNTYTGGTVINQGVLAISSDVNLGDAAGGVAFGGGTLRTMADMSTGRTLTLAGNGTIDTLGALTLNGAMAGSSRLTKTGTGTLVIAGDASGFAGDATVADGVLQVTGTFGSAATLVDVLSGAMLSGTGTVGGDVAVADGGVLEAGVGGAGTLAIAGDLTLASGSALNFELGDAGVAGGMLNDLVSVGGDLVLAGTLNVSVPAGGDFTAGVYRLFDYGGALTNNGLAFGATPAGGELFVQTSILGQVNLVNTAGLTLNFWDGEAGPKNDGLLQGGDGVWRLGGGSTDWTEVSAEVNADYVQNAFAIFMGAGGTVTVDNTGGAVGASGLQFASDGYTIAGDALTLSGAMTEIRVGDGSPDDATRTATISATLAGSSELVKSGAGALVLSGANTYSGGTVINQGVLAISSDANLGDAAGGVAFGGGTLRTMAGMTSARAVALTGAGTVRVDPEVSVTLSGLFSGAGAFAKDGTGELILTGNSTTYSGVASVLAGTLVVNGALGGSMDVLAGARLEGAGSVGATTHRADAVIAPGDGGLGTLTINGDYVGMGGILEIEAVLGDDASPADRLVVNGSTSGETSVVLINREGLGAQTVDGIKIIDVTGASGGVFTLEGDYFFQDQPTVIVGAYGYRLYKNGVATPTDGDWYLRSALLDSPEEPPLYQPGVPVYEAYPQTLLALNGLTSFHERVGGRVHDQTTTGEGSNLWVRVEGGRLRAEAKHSTSFSDLEMDTWKVQMGGDRVLQDRQAGAMVGGLSVHYGELKAGVVSPFGAGEIDTTTYGVNAALTWFGRGGVYADGQAQFSWYESDLESRVLGALEKGNQGQGQAFSLEIGKSSPLSSSMTVTPQAQLTYSEVSFDGFTDGAGADVSLDAGESLRTRLGLTLDHNGGGDGKSWRSHLYGVVNVTYEWKDTTVTSVSGEGIGRANDRLWGQLGVGGRYSLGGGLTLHGQITADTSLADFGESYSVRGVAGLKIAF